MLLRGANGVAYKSLPDNAIYQFCKQAKRNGMDIFRVFDALNDIDQLEVGMRAVQEAGGVVEGTMCYSGELESALQWIKQITNGSFTGDMLVCLVFFTSLSLLFPSILYPLGCDIWSPSDGNGVLILISISPPIEEYGVRRSTPGLFELFSH
jgi:hypothetical protein